MASTAKRLRAQDAVELLRRHEISPPVADPRYLAHGQTERGVRVSIDIAQYRDGERITLSHETFHTARLVPLSEFEAGTMVDQLESEALVPLSENAHSMLVHMLVHGAQLYRSASLTRLVLDPVFVRENDYNIVGVGMWADKRLRLRHRLGKHAHDAGAVFAYRPTARGRGSIR